MRKYGESPSVKIKFHPFLNLFRFLIQMLTFKICKSLKITLAPIPSKRNITWVILGNIYLHFAACYFTGLKKN